MSAQLNSTKRFEINVKVYEKMNNILMKQMKVMQKQFMKEMKADQYNPKVFPIIEQQKEFYAKVMKMHNKFIENIETVFEEIYVYESRRGYDLDSSGDNDSIDDVRKVKYKESSNINIINTRISSNINNNNNNDNNGNKDTDIKSNDQ